MILFGDCFNENYGLCIILMKESLSLYHKATNSNTKDWDT